MKMTPGKIERKWITIDYLDVQEGDKILRYAATGQLQRQADEKSLHEGADYDCLDEHIR